MKNMIFDKRSGLWYEKKGGYYLPCLTLPAEEEKPIGLWGRRHLLHLKEHKRLVYLNLLTSGRLHSYLVAIDEQATDMFFRLVKEYADRQGVTEQLKTENEIKWIQMMSNIRSAVEEIVLTDLINV